MLNINSPRNPESPATSISRRFGAGLATVGVAAALSLSGAGTAMASPEPAPHGSSVMDTLNGKAPVKSSPQDSSDAKPGKKAAKKQDREVRKAQPGVQRNAAPKGPQVSDAQVAPVAQVESVGDRIIKAAQPEIGTKESGGDNCNKYSPQCVAWCSLFAMEQWEKAGVAVDNEELAFTGNLYELGQQKGTAFDADHLNEAKPGDVLLWGTGPSSPETSKHVGIVEKIDGDQVTTIEGNSGDNTDEVVRKVHTLSADKFYGGVHPW